MYSSRYFLCFLNYYGVFLPVSGTTINCLFRLNRSVKKKFGEEQVRLWRRSFDATPPGGESLRDTFNRAVPFFKKFIEKDLKAGKNVLVVSSGNALRSIVKYIENISDEKIIDLELPFGGLTKYDFEDGKYTKI